MTLMMLMLIQFSRNIKKTIATNRVLGLQHLFIY
jgi:hypothetical protein